MKLWNLRELSIVFGVVTLNRNYASDGALEITKNSPDYVLEMSSDGIGTMYTTNDDSAKMVLMLAQSSELNAVLSAIRAADKLTPNGAGISNWSARDRSGTSVYDAPQARITSPPNPKFNKTPNTREWTWETDMLLDFTGGT